jgi:hypothetical protein
LARPGRDGERYPYGRRMKPRYGNLNRVLNAPIELAGMVDAGVHDEPTSGLVPGRPEVSGRPGLTVPPRYGTLWHEPF